MQLIKRIVFFISLFALYLIFRELLELYAYAYAAHPYLGYAVLFLILAVLVYFVFIPVYKIITLPVNPGPVSEKSKEEELIALRVQKFKKNKFLKTEKYQALSEDNRENYTAAVQILSRECEKIRQRYVAQLFYSSSISQNGFIDAILVLSYSVNMIKEIFILYHGRVNNRDLWQIAKKVYFSVAIAGSEGIEYVTDEIITKLASDSMKSIPFIDKILGSIADGFLNALLLNRVSYITENYCTMTYLEKPGNLYPSPARVFKATKHITADITDKLILVIKRISIDKTVNFAVVALNPIGYVWERTFDRLIADKSIDEKGFLKNLIIETGKFAGNPVTYGIGKIYNLYKLATRPYGV
jgi:hypothetical protein